MNRQDNDDTGKSNHTPDPFFRDVRPGHQTEEHTSGNPAENIQIGNVPISTPRLTKKQQRALDRQRVKYLRAQNEKNQQQAFDKKQARKAELITLSKYDKKAFLEHEKIEKQQRAELEAAAHETQRRAYAALSPAEKAEYKAEQARQKRLKKRAKKSYVPLQIIKYVIIAVLLAGIIYIGDVAYGTFVDNSAAFADTDQALTRPPESAAPSVQVTTAPSSSSSASASPTPTLNPYDLLLTQADLDFMKDRVNILVLGIDESLERADWSSFRTDTMILVSVDFAAGDVFMLSLPRDSYVPIYNKDTYNKINTAFSSGGGYKKNGFEYAMNTVSMTLGGVPVNHYLCFDMNVVKEVVNTIGGLDYDVDIKVNMCGRTIEKGLQHLDGQQVLDYCRQRKGDSDIARVDRQQRMIMAIFNEVKSTGQIQDIPEMYSAITGNIYTDLTLKQIASLAAFAMNVQLESIDRYTLPGDFLNIDGTSFWGVNQYEKRDLIKQLFNADISVSDADDVGTLKALADEKRAAVSAASVVLANAASWRDANAVYMTGDETAELNSRINSLGDVAAIVNIQDVGSTIAPITTAASEFSTWFSALQAAVQARRTATPTPAPDVPAPPPAESTAPPA